MGEIGSYNIPIKLGDGEICSKHINKELDKMLELGAIEQSSMIIIIDFVLSQVEPGF